MTPKGHPTDRRRCSKSQDSAHGFPRRGDPADRKNCSEEVRILKIQSPEGETPQAEMIVNVYDIIGFGKRQFKINTSIY